jgi:hypothetical protein
VIEEQVTNHQDPATAFGKCAKRGRLAPGQTQRLFHEDVFARAQSGFSNLEVGGGVCGHHDGRDGRIVENDLQVSDHGNAWMKRRHGAPGSFVTIAHITKIGLWDGSIVADVVLTPTAGPDDGNPHRL